MHFIIVTATELIALDAGTYIVEGAWSLVEEEGEDEEEGGPLGIPEFPWDRQGWSLAPGPLRFAALGLEDHSLILGPTFTASVFLLPFPGIPLPSTAPSLGAGAGAVPGQLAAPAGPSSLREAKESDSVPSMSPTPLNGSPLSLIPTQPLGPESPLFTRPKEEPQRREKGPGGGGGGGGSCGGGIGGGGGRGRGRGKGKPPLNKPVSFHSKVKSSGYGAVAPRKLGGGTYSSSPSSSRATPRKGTIALSTAGLLGRLLTPALLFVFLRFFFAWQRKSLNHTPWTPAL